VKEAGRKTDKGKFEREREIHTKRARKREIEKGCIFLEINNHYHHGEAV
jgi:hypothetical protein